MIKENIIKTRPLNVILGASDNPARASYTAAQLFQDNRKEWIPIGIKASTILGKEILNLREKPLIENVDTITLYISPANQIEWYEYILSLKPRRIIFNPGTENNELVSLAKSAGIKTENACTLVLLSTGQYSE